MKIDFIVDSVRQLLRGAEISTEQCKEICLIAQQHARTNIRDVVDNDKYLKKIDISLQLYLQNGILVNIDTNINGLRDVERVQLEIMRQNALACNLLALATLYTEKK